MLVRFFFSWYILCFLRVSTRFFTLSLLSWTVMNVSLDTLHNSEWSEYFCRPLLYIPYRYAFARLCLSLANHVKTAFKLSLQFQSYVEPIWSVYNVNAFFWNVFPSPKCFLIFEKLKSGWLFQHWSCCSFTDMYRMFTSIVISMSHIGPLWMYTRILHLHGFTFGCD